jgi:alcohol dehydrogenase
MSNVDQSSAIENLSAFDFDPRTHVIFGSGTVSRLGEIAKQQGRSRVLLVTDPGIERAGHAAKAAESLKQVGLEVTVFHDVQVNPTDEDVVRGVQIAKQQRIDLIVAVGGGSAMDCAKGINFVLTNGGEIKDYWGVGKAKLPMLPLIAVPTTAGTGSEAQSFALIADSKTHMKMACGDKKAACRIAILDPELTLSMPAGVAAATGIDAISHALESYVTTKRNTISQLFARQAWQLLARSFPVVCPSLKQPPQPNGDSTYTSHPTEILAARGNMLLGAHFAGAAIENSMLGATHSLANPLTANFNVTHGWAIGIMLPHVIRYNAFAVGSLYGQLANDLGICSSADPTASDQIAELIRQLTVTAGLPTNLKMCNVDRKQLPQLANDASKQWTATFNPRPVDVASLLRLYEAAFDE